jgi:hypothetical protein
MDGIMTVREVIEELSGRNPDAPVMIAVIKYPDEFAIRFKDGVPSWADSTDVECIPLETGEITTTHEGVVMMAVELEEYDAVRHASQ